MERQYRREAPKEIEERALPASLTGWGVVDLAGRRLGRVLLVADYPRERFAVLSRGRLLRRHAVVSLRGAYRDRGCVRVAAQLTRHLPAVPLVMPAPPAHPVPPTGGGSHAT